MQKTTTKAFTLIELLIVVAIIAILAAIAVPNFLEAQTRAKVSRAKNDMRTYATGLEAYFIDNNSYVPCSSFGIVSRGIQPTAKPVFERLSSPIAYLTSGIMPNAFSAKRRTTNADAQGTADTPTFAALTPQELGDPAYKSYMYQSGNDTGRTGYSGSNGNPVLPTNGSLKSTLWILHSPGPANVYYNLGGVLAFSSITGGAATSNLDQCIKLIYDPTNGTISNGTIWRAGGQTNSDYAYNMVRAIQTQK